MRSVQVVVCLALLGEAEKSLFWNIWLLVTLRVTLRHLKEWKGQKKPVQHHYTGTAAEDVWVPTLHWDHSAVQHLSFVFLGSSVLIFRHSDMLWKLGSNKGQASSTLDFLRNTIQLSGAQQHRVAKASMEKLFNLWTSAGHLPEIPRPVLAPPPLEVVQRSTAPLGVRWVHLLIKLKEMEKRQWQKGYKPINWFSKQGYRSVGHFLSGWRK